MTTKLDTIMRAIPYERMSTNYLIGEMLRLQRYAQWLKDEANKYAKHSAQPNFDYWRGCYQEYMLVAGDAQLCEDILNLRWRGYV